MSSSTAPSVWNAVEIEIDGENRSIAHSRTTSGSSPSNSTLSSPASRSSSSSPLMPAPAAVKPPPALLGRLRRAYGSYPLLLLGGLAAGEFPEVVVGAAVAERPERLAVGAGGDP